MVRVNINILGISKLKWMGMGKFNSGDHCIYYCGQESLRRIHLPMLDTWVQSLGWEDPLEKGMATHSSILSSEVPWTEEPGGLQSMGSQRAGHVWIQRSTKQERILWDLNLSIGQRHHCTSRPGRSGGTSELLARLNSRQHQYILQAFIQLWSSEGCWVFVPLSAFVQRTEQKS